MDYRKSYSLLLCGVGGGAVLAFFAIAQASLALGIAGAIAIAGGLLQARLFYRCPHCKALLPLRGGQISRCPDCGESLSF